MDSPRTSARCRAARTSLATSGRTMPITSFTACRLPDPGRAAYGRLDKDRANVFVHRVQDLPSPVGPSVQPLGSGTAMAIDRTILIGPDWVARAAASAVRDPRQRWMLRQPRAVRRSYADEVLGRPGE